mmetsp:Transcript_47868/g.72385  ORF Transcript_47868/g.72385 Transcript_47868/m.72385 type:complete len:107 (+) Transcript_47868:1983-2303(+)
MKSDQAVLMTALDALLVPDAAAAAAAERRLVRTPAPPQCNMACTASADISKLRLRFNTSVLVPPPGATTAFEALRRRRTAEDVAVADVAAAGAERFLRAIFSSCEM